MGCSTIKPTFIDTTVTREIGFIRVSGKIDALDTELGIKTWMTFTDQSGISSTGHTKIDGSYDFLLYTGTYEVTIKRSGYRLYEETIELDGSDRRIVIPEITLIPES